MATFYYSGKITEFKLKVGDEIIVSNGVNMHEPFYDYEFRNIPESVIHVQRNLVCGGEEGTPKKRQDIFTFPAEGTFTMTIRDNNISESKLITMIVTKCKSEKKFCSVL